ncbi:MAG: ABC transporter substrate-binding protein [Bdellovibrionales bacterium]
MNKSVFGLFFSLILSLVTLVGCTKKTDEILVGEFGTLTGSEATFGQSTNKGLRMAFDEINAAGGIKGKKIKLITYDNQGKNDESAAVVTRLITQDKVVAIIGEVASARTIAAAPIAQQYKVPMISPSSTNPKVTKDGEINRDYVFRICFIDPFQGAVMARFMIDNLKLKKVAILRDVKNEYSIGLADTFVKEVLARGGEVVIDVSYQSNDIDFKAQLTQIKAKSPEAIFVPGYYTDAGLITVQARQLGIKSTFLGGDGWDSPKLHEIAKEAANGAYFSNHYATDSSEPIVQEFIQKYQKRFNELPDAMAALGYDAGKVLAEALKNVKEFKPELIRNEIAKTKGFPGVTGNITLDENRNAIKSAVVVRVDGNDKKFVTQINP